MLGRKGAEADVDRKFVACLTQAEELKPGSHRSRPGVGAVAVPVTGMCSAEPFGKQCLDGLAEHFVSREPEEPLGLGVDEGDVPVRVDDHHRVRCRFEEGTERRRIGPEPVAARRARRFRRAHAGYGKPSLYQAATRPEA